MGAYDEELARIADISALTACSAAAAGMQVRCCDQCDEDGCCAAGCLPRVEYSPAAAIWLIEREFRHVSPEARKLAGLDTRDGKRRAGRAFAPSGEHIRLMPDTDANSEETAELIARMDAYCETLLDMGTPARSVVSMYCAAEAKRTERTQASQKRAKNRLYMRLRNALMKEGRWHYRRLKTYVS